MTDSDNLILAVLIGVAALLYASVGHAGASGYLAAMALLGIEPAMMKPTALALNILVASIATWKFYRVGAFSWKLFLPLVITSAPCAYAGGLLTLPSDIYKPLVGAVLVFSAWRSLVTSTQTGHAIKTPPLPLLLACGSALGFLSGLTGVGGGIFLSPLLLFFRWAETRTISGVAAAFIWVNSVAGLLGVISSSTTLPAALPWWMLAAAAGGYIGAEIGSKRLKNSGIQKMLAIVLLVAGVKMLFT